MDNENFESNNFFPVKNNNPTSHAGHPTYFLYFKGEIPTWAAFRNKSTFSITYEQLLTDFLNVISTEFNLNYQVDEVVFTNLKTLEVIPDLSKEIDLNCSYVDFYVRPINYKSNNSREQPQLIPPYCYKFVNEGKFLEKQGHYYGAFAFYEVVILHGIRDLARMLFKTKNWNSLRVYIDHLLCFYPDDEQIFKIAAICCERLGDSKKAFEIYSKYQNSSNFMKIGNYRLSPSLNRDKSNFALTVSRALSGPDAYDPFLLEQIIRLSLHFRKIEFGIDCCFRHPKTVKYLVLFSKNATFYEQVIQKVTQSVTDDYSAAVRTTQLLYKSGAKLLAIDVARALRPKKKGGKMMMARLYSLVFLLFMDFRFDELVLRFSKFFSILSAFSSSSLYVKKKSGADKDLNGDFNVFEMLQLLQNVPQFNDKIVFNVDSAAIKEPHHFQRLVKAIEGNIYFSGEGEFEGEMIGLEAHLELVEEKKYFLSIIVLVCGFLFNEGFLQIARDLIQKVEAQVSKLPTSVGRIEFDDEVVSVFRTIRWHFIRGSSSHLSPFFSMSSGKVFVVGDEYANIPAYVKFGRNTIVNQMIPRAIPGLTLWELKPSRIFFPGAASNIRNGEPASGNRLTFFDLIDFLAKNYDLSYAGIMIVLGTNDCEVVIPKLTKKLLLKSLAEAVETEVSILIALVQRIHKLLPNIEIFVHTVMPRFKWSAVIANCFNAKLKEKLPNYAVLVNPFKVESILDTIELTNNLPTVQYTEQIKKIIEKIDFQKNR